MNGILCVVNVVLSLLGCCLPAFIRSKVNYRESIVFSSRTLKQSTVDARCHRSFDIVALNQYTTLLILRINVTDLLKTFTKCWLTASSRRSVIMDHYPALS